MANIFKHYSLNALISFARGPLPLVPPPSPTSIPLPTWPSASAPWTPPVPLSRNAKGPTQASVERDRIAATKVLIARYQCGVAAKKKAVAAKGPLPLDPEDFIPVEEFIPPELEDFIRALGHQIFASGDPSANLSAVLGERRKTGRARKDDLNMAVATAVFEIHNGCREVELEPGKVVKRLGPETGPWPGPRIARTTYEAVANGYITDGGHPVHLSADQVKDIYLRRRKAVAMDAALAGHLGPFTTGEDLDGVEK